MADQLKFEVQSDIGSLETALKKIIEGLDKIVSRSTDISKAINATFKTLETSAGTSIAGITSKLTALNKELTKTVANFAKVTAGGRAAGISKIFKDPIVREAVKGDERGLFAEAQKAEEKARADAKIAEAKRVAEAEKQIRQTEETERRQAEAARRKQERLDLQQRLEDRRQAAKAEAQIRREQAAEELRIEKEIAKAKEELAKAVANARKDQEKRYADELKRATAERDRLVKQSARDEIQWAKEQLAANRANVQARVREAHAELANRTKAQKEAANAAIKEERRITQEAKTQAREREQIARKLAAARVAAAREVERAEAVSQRNLKKLTDGFLRTTNHIITAIKRVALLGGGLLIGGGFVAAARRAIEFQKEVSNVATILGDAAPQLEQFRSGLIEISKTTNKDLVDLTKGLYDAISAGIPATTGAGGALEFLAVAQKAAVAGLGTTAEAVNAGTRIINTFGKEAGTIPEIFDKIFQTIRDGVITFPLIAKNIGEVSGVASQFGVTYNEVLASVARVSRVLPGAETFTAIRALLISLAAPSVDAGKYAKKLGIEIGETALATKGLVGVLQGIVNDKNGLPRTAAEIRRLIPEVTAQTAAFALARNGGKDYADQLQRTAEGTGQLNDALAQRRKSIDFNLGVLRNNFDAVVAQVTQRFTPEINDAIVALSESFQKLSVDSIVQWTKEVGETLKTVGKYLYELADVFKLIFEVRIASSITKFIAGGIGGLMTASKKLSAVFVSTTTKATLLGGALEANVGKVNAVSKATGFLGTTTVKAAGGWAALISRMQTFALAATAVTLAIDAIARAWMDLEFAFGEDGSGIRNAKRNLELVKQLTESRAKAAQDEIDHFKQIIAKHGQLIDEDLNERRRLLVGKIAFFKTEEEAIKKNIEEKQKELSNLMELNLTSRFVNAKAIEDISNNIEALKKQARQYEYNAKTYEDIVNNLSGLVKRAEKEMTLPDLKLERDKKAKKFSPVLDPGASERAKKELEDYSRILAEFYAIFSHVVEIGPATQEGLALYTLFFDEGIAGLKKLTASYRQAAADIEAIRIDNENKVAADQKKAAELRRAALIKEGALRQKLYEKAAKYFRKEGDPTEITVGRRISLLVRSILPKFVVSTFDSVTNSVGRFVGNTFRAIEQKLNISLSKTFEVVTAGVLDFINAPLSAIESIITQGFSGAVGSFFSKMVQDQLEAADKAEASGNRIESRLRRTSSTLISIAGSVITSLASQFEELVSLAGSTRPFEAAVAFNERFMATKDFIRNLVANLPLLFHVLPRYIDEIVKMFIDKLPAIVDAFAAGMPLVVDALVRNVGPLLDAFIAEIPTIIRSIVNQLPKLIQAFLAEVVPRIPEAISVIVEGIVSSFIVKADRIIEAIVVGLKEALKDLIPDPTDPEELGKTIITVAEVVAAVAGVSWLANWFGGSDEGPSGEQSIDPDRESGLSPGELTPPAPQEPGYEEGPPNWSGIRTRPSLPDFVGMITASLLSQQTKLQGMMSGIQNTIMTGLQSRPDRNTFSELSDPRKSSDSPHVVISFEKGRGDRFDRIVEESVVARVRKQGGNVRNLVDLQREGKYVNYPRPTGFK